MLQANRIFMFIPIQICILVLIGGVTTRVFSVAIWDGNVLAKLILCWFAGMVAFHSGVLFSRIFTQHSYAAFQKKRSKDKKKKRGTKPHEKPDTDLNKPDSDHGKPETDVKATKVLDDDILCSICLDNEADHLFIPCGHVCVCMNCSQRVLDTTSTCPLCRLTCTAAYRVYLPSSGRIQPNAST